MKKREYIRRWASMILAVTLLFNQIPVSLADGTNVYAQEENQDIAEQALKEENTAAVTGDPGAIFAAENPDDEVPADVSVDEPEEEAAPAGTDEDTAQEGMGASVAAGAEEAVIDNTSDEEPSEIEESRIPVLYNQMADETGTAKVNAGISLEEVSANHYELHVKWQVTGTQGEITALALGMDTMTYESLPESVKADENGICHIRLENGEIISMGRETEEEEPERILLVYEQAGDGELSLDLELSNENAADAQESVITAQWLNAEDAWVIAENAELQWRTDAQDQTGTEAAAEPETEAATEPETESEPETGVIEPVNADMIMAMDGESAGIDLTTYLTDVKVSTPASNNTFEVSMSYKISTDVLWKSGTRVVTYTLPQNISSTKVFNGKVMDKGEAVGEYVVDSATGKITITFDEGYITETPEEIEGTLSFRGKVNEGAADENGKVTIEFSDKYTSEIIINTQVTDQYDVSVDKKSAGYTTDHENNTITFYYEVEVTSQKGTGKEISIEDKLRYLKGNPTTTFYNSDIQVVKYDAVGTRIEGYSGKLHITEGKKNEDGTQYTDDPTISGSLPALAEREKYVIRYSVTKILDGNTTSGDLHNDITISNENVNDTDYNYSNGELYDLSVKKESPEAPVIDQENGTVKNTYKIRIDSVNGTKDDIALEDYLRITDGEIAGAEISYTVTSIKKCSAGSQETSLGADTLVYDEEEGKLKGSLPALAAGEYYEIEYAMILSNLSADAKVSFKLNNTVKVGDKVNQKQDSDSDTVNWQGKEYCDWIDKKGSYDATNGKITWTIILNQGAYGNIDGMTLRDIMELPGEENGTAQEEIEVSLWEKVYEEDNGYGWRPSTDYGPYKVTLPYEFQDSATVQDAYGRERIIHTTNEFRITYETPVDISTAEDFVNVYHNEAYIGDHKDDDDIIIPKDIIEKSFSGSEEAKENGTEGFKLNWVTYLDIPADGLKENSYYSDTISDYVNGESNNNNWFTAEMLQETALTIGTKILVPEVDYKLTVSGKKENSGESFADIPLSEVEAGGKINKFKIVFLKDIDRTTEGEKLAVHYSSFVKGSEIAYNTGTYTKGNISVSDQKNGRGEGGNLLKKTNADGTENTSKALSAIYDKDLEKYILTYKLVVNGSNSASGDMTIIDMLPAGTELVTGKWTCNGTVYDPESATYIDGVYVKYYEYDQWKEDNNQSPYLTNESDTIRVCFKEGSWLDKGSAKANGVTAEAENGVLTVKIPERAYKPVFKAEDFPNWISDPDHAAQVAPSLSLSMVLYYAVAIDPAQLEGYESEITNHCSLTTTNGGEGSSSVTNTIVTEQIGKQGKYDKNTKTLSYSVDINSKGITMLEGAEGEITVEDILEYEKEKWCGKCNEHHPCVTQVDLKPDSLKLYEVEKADDGAEIEVITSDSFSSSLIQEDRKVRLTVKVPDGKHYRLKYEYMLNIDPGAMACDDMMITVKNTAKINGSSSLGGSSEDEEKFEAYSSTATATKSYTMVTLYKRDKNNQVQMLEGAEFKLERFNGEGWSVVNGHSQKEDGTESDTFTTNEDGMVKLGEKLNDTTYRIAYNCAYRLTEVKAPKGYKILTDPMYFIVENSFQKTKIVPEGWEMNQLYTQHMLNVISGGYLFVDNEEQEDDKTDFEVAKVWKNADGTTAKPPSNGDGTAKTVTVKLYKTTSETDMSGWNEVGRATLSPDNNWRYIWSNLDKYENGSPLYYFVREEELPEGWSVSYSNDKAVAANGENRLIEITNTEKKETTSIKVKKTWQQVNGAEFDTAPEEQAVIYLKRKYQIKTDGTQSPEVSVTVNVTGKNAKTEAGAEGQTARTTTSKLDDVPYGSVVTITMNSVSFSKFAEVAVISPATTASYAEESVQVDAAEETWVGKETVSFPVYEDTTVTIGNEYCIYDFESLVVSYTEETISTDWIIDKDFAERRVLSPANSWQYEWETLPATHPSGNPYYYYIEEDPMKGYETTYSNNDGITEGELEVTNKATSEKYTSITVKKQWQNADGTPKEDGYPGSVWVQLYRKGEEEAAQDEMYGPQIELGSSHAQDTSGQYEDDGWSYTWENLPEGEYYVIETAVNGYEIIYQNDAQETEGQNSTSGNEAEAAVSGGTITITNKEESTDIEVEKIWSDGNGNHSNEQVRMKLYRTTKAPETGGDDTPTTRKITVAIDHWYDNNGKEVTDSAIPSSGWKWIGFYDSTGKLIKDGNLLPGENWTKEYAIPVDASGYYLNGSTPVQDHSSDGSGGYKDIATIDGSEYIPIPDGTADYRVSLSAKLVGGGSTEAGNSITVKVEWDGEIPEGETAYIKVPICSDKSYSVIRNIELRSGSWEMVCDGLDGDASTIYYIEGWNIKEKGPGIGGLWVTGTAGDNRAEKDGTLTIHATYQSESVANSCTTKEDTVVCTVNRYSEQTMAANAADAVSQKPDDAEAMGSEYDKILSAGNDWKAKWENLPKTDASGKTYYYYVEEEVPPGYEASYDYAYRENNPVQGIAKVTITNTPDSTIEYTSIPVRKVWTGYGQGETDGYTVTVALNKTVDGATSKVAEEILSKDNNWSYTWENMVKGPEYSVSEIEVKDGSGNVISNFDVTYTEENGTYVITNTKKKQGIILPGTGSKYPLVFYGLGSAFLLVSVIWMFLTFKKSNIPIDTGKGGRRSNK